MKLGVLLAGRRPEDVAQRLEQARDAGFSLCQLNLHQGGLTRGDLAAIADQTVEHGVRPIAVGYNVNPIKPNSSGSASASRADLEVLLHSLDIIGARKVVLWTGTHADALFDDHPANSSPDSVEVLRAFITDVVKSTRARHYFLVLEPWRTHVLRSERDVILFHASLDPATAERVRYVLDAPSLMTPDRYCECDSHADAICDALGPLAGVVHLRDCIMPPDAEESMPGPGRGKLDYSRYVGSIHKSVSPETGAIVRNVPACDYASIRDYLLRLSPHWQLA